MVANTTSQEQSNNEDVSHHLQSTSSTSSSSSSSSTSFLFNPDKLKGLDWTSVRNKLSPFITNEMPGDDNFVLRPLRIDDYDKGYLDLLSQLTTVGEISKAEFEDRFKQMQKESFHYIIVIEDISINKIIASSTLVIELKFIHRCGLRGRGEDIVVNNFYRGKQLGKLMVLTATLLSKKLNCYKISLECKDRLVPFYESLGYVMEPGNANSLMLRWEPSKL